MTEIPLTTLNGAYLLFAGILIWFFILGLTMVNAGLVQSKNILALLLKCILGFSLVCLIYLGWVHPLIYLKDNFANPYFPNLRTLFVEHRFWSNYFNTVQPEINIPLAFFHACQAGIFILIVIGSSAETLKIWALVWFAILYTIFIYPFFSYWMHGNGFLKTMGFIDFNGASTIFVAAAGAALSGLFILGTRENKYPSKTKSLSQRIKPILGNNLPFSCFGLFLIWLGTFGLNTSYLADGEHALSIDNVAAIFLSTSTAAASALLMVAFISRTLYRRVDVSLVINGGMLGLAALVAYPLLTNLSVVLVFGLIAGAVGSFFIVVLDKLRVDDPLGAIGVYGIGGLWSLLNVAYSISFLAEKVQGNKFSVMLSQFLIQLNGAAIIFCFSFIGSLIIWLLIRLIIGLRISKELEVNGLDKVECGARAYPEFVTQDQRYWMD